MITNRNFDPRKGVQYVWRDVALAGGAATAVALLHQTGYALALPFAPVAVLGTALAIFLAFRANTAFARWQEGAQLWANIVNASRIFARLIITFTDSHQHTAVYNHEVATQFKQEMLYRHLAWVNALRLHLRQQEIGTELNHFLPHPSDHDLLRAAQNLPTQLLQKQGQAIYGAMATGVLQGFDSFQLEGQLAALSAAQANCERLKTIPIPRQYDYFTRLFVRLFVLVLPLFLLNTAVADGSVWLILPLTLLIAFLFTTIERIAAVNEDPFENRLTDVPLTALCRQIERDLREMLGEETLPASAVSQDGYLW